MTSRFRRIAEPIGFTIFGISVLLVIAAIARLYLFGK